MNPMYINYYLLKESAMDPMYINYYLFIGDYFNGQ